MLPFFNRLEGWLLHSSLWNGAGRTDGLFHDPAAAGPAAVTVGTPFLLFWKET
jgi:hypothetical protein